MDCNEPGTVMPRRPTSGSLAAFQQDLYTVLPKFNGSQASDKRDKIYALTYLLMHVTLTIYVRIIRRPFSKLFVMPLHAYLARLTSPPYNGGILKQLHILEHSISR